MGEPNAKLWIGNLCYKVDKEDLDQLFRKYGQINDIKILDKGPHVYAFVEFDKVESGIEAFKNLQGHDLKGQAMKIEYSCGRKRSNHRDRDHEQKYRGKRESYKRRSRSRSNDKHKKKSKSHRRRSSSSGSSRRHKSKQNKTKTRSPDQSLGLSNS